jgi:hypothetical protein
MKPAGHRGDIMRSALLILTLLLACATAAQAARYGSLRDVESVSLSASVNEAALALGLNPPAVKGFVSGRLSAEGLATDRNSAYRLVMLLDAISLGTAPADTAASGTHFVVVRMYLVRDRANGTLVLWEDMAYGGWSQRGPAAVIAEVEDWLDRMSRDLVLDYYRDAASDRAALTP